MSISTLNTGLPNLARPKELVVGRRQFEALQRELISVRAREEFLLNAMHEQTVRHKLAAQEFEHRLVNGLQLIASLLSLQARAAASSEVAEQLAIASRRVASLGRVHHRLHQFDEQEHVEFGSYLRHLCDDLSNLLFEGRTDYAVGVETANASIPSKLAIPLGFIINELLTNAAKYARGKIAVRFDESAAGYFLSVVDDGPGLPPEYDPAKSKGLGMKIVLSLLKQIGGTLQFAPGDGGRGTRFTVAFATAKVDFRGAGRPDKIGNETE